MNKTILAVVAFLVIALTVQIYQQDQLHSRIANQQQDAEKAHADNIAKELEAEKTRQSASGNAPRYAPAIDKVVLESFRVPEGPPREFDFTVNADQMTDVTVSGHFAVSGAHPSGIEFFIFDEDDYENWIDGNSAVALYAAGQQTSGDVNMRITKSGRYNLVFKNSSSHDVDVNANFQLQYEKFATYQRGAAR
jgi:hypothetical protein